MVAQLAITLIYFFAAMIWSAISSPIGASIAAGQAKDSATAFAVHQMFSYSGTGAVIISIIYSIISLWILWKPINIILNSKKRGDEK